jgi:FkbM family methyltransferase
VIAAQVRLDPPDPTKPATELMLSLKKKMFIARAMNRVVRLLRRLAGQGMRTRCERRGVMWDLDLDEGIDLSIYLLGSYEPSMLRAYSSVIHPGDVVFDIGANIGAHTLHFARLVGPTGRVFAFEPTDYAAAKIRLNLAINPELARRVSVQQRFLVAGNSEALPASVAARWPVGSDQAGLDGDHFGRPESLAHALAVTADDFCEAENLGRLDFVKIDVDGHEYSVLRGFHRSLERFRPRILIELAPLLYKDANTSDFDHYVRFIADLGYSFTEARTGRPLSSDPAALRRHISPGCTMNCLVYPSGKQ